MPLAEAGWKDRRYESSRSLRRSKEEADKGRGVITDSAVHQRVLAELQEFVGTQAGLFCWRAVVESPLLGPAGNKEFLALIEKVR